MICKVTNIFILHDKCKYFEDTNNSPQRITITMVMAAAISLLRTIFNEYLDKCTFPYRPLKKPTHIIDDCLT